MALVLVVDDDDAATRMALRHDLERSGFVVTEAHDGLEACMSIVSARPDFIIMDWDMPQLDGREATLRLHTDPTTADIPIIMLTSRSGRKSRAAAFRAGARAFAEKPFHLADIVRNVEECLMFSA